MKQTSLITNLTNTSRLNVTTALYRPVEVIKVVASLHGPLKGNGRACLGTQNVLSIGRPKQAAQLWHYHVMYRLYAFNDREERKDKCLSKADDKTFYRCMFYELDE